MVNVLIHQNTAHDETMLLKKDRNALMETRPASATKRSVRRKLASWPSSNQT